MNIAAQIVLADQELYLGRVGAYTDHVEDYSRSLRR